MKPTNRILSGLALAALVSCSHAQPEPQQQATAPAKPPAPRTFDQMAAVDVPGLATQLTPDQVTAACKQAETTADAKLAALVAVPDAQRSFANSFNAYEQAMADYSDDVGRLSFLKDIHPDAKTRAAAAGCEEESGKYFVKVGARKDIYLALKAYLANAGKADTLDAEDKRLVDLTMRDFKRNGLELSDADREKLVQIRSRLAELATKYSSNLDEDTTTFEATDADLEGMPEEFIESHLKDKPKAGAAPAAGAPAAGKAAGPTVTVKTEPGAKGKKGKAAAKKPTRPVVLSTKYPDFYPIMENAKNEQLRKKMWFAMEGRESAKNLPLLTEAVKLRDQAAKLLGYPTHADFVTEDRMAKDSKTVTAFLDRLRTELLPARDELNKQMLALKVAETGDKKAVLETWDWRYYLNQIKKKSFSIDNEAVRAYFPADKVMAGMFQVYSTLFNVKFNEVANAPVWADGVKLYEVHDGLDGKGKLLAKFYVDLFPREGKYGHAASFNFGVARATAAGYQIPISALVVNFNPPKNGQSARLSFEEVDVLFHEFGHIMHGSLTTARYASQSGTNVSTDFVEAPSQMLENWVYRPEVLALVSEDPKNPGHPLPDDLAKRLSAARTFDAGIRYTRQVYLASFDMALHTRGADVDPDKVEHEVRQAITGYPSHPNDEHTAANFGHLMGGYDAGYYGYLWSEVYADDMFSRFEKDGILSPTTGKAYRDAILANGRTREPMELLKQFLGREPNDEAFLRLTGIKKG
ncbi:MAG: Zn-dependent oligopeptidase [Deltaproteobacteria bacterium]|nr:Zn-dependent oligopeptidase [Deltaproteobacteria bacterium]